jgi:hypothetical protein
MSERVAKPGSQQAEERERLPLGSRAVFDQLVDEYKFHCIRHYGRPLASYKVLADLVRDGWRPSTADNP